VLVTAILQISSAVSLMVLFVGAGIMQMENAVGVILDSNIGTTLTAWIVATVGFKMKIEPFALPFIGIAAAGLILFRPGIDDLESSDAGFPNRQACRMMVFSMKDLLLTPEQIQAFNRKTSL
jgi:hypothetical protein